MLTVEQIAEGWFFSRGAFWGTINQILLCARCGGHDCKPHNEPRHFRDITKPTLHVICDRCWDDLPDEFEYITYRKDQPHD